MEILNEVNQSLGKPQQRGFPFHVMPVEPADFVVLAVGVVVASLGAADLVAHQQHGGALSHK